MTGIDGIFIEATWLKRGKYFFPQKIAQKIKFYGWGDAYDKSARILVHHCISIIRNVNYRHKGIGTNLIKHSLEWAKPSNGKGMKYMVFYPI